MIEITWRQLYELIPIPLAWVVLLYSGYKFASTRGHERRRRDYVNLVLGAVIALGELLAQTGWFLSVVTGASLGFSDLLWTAVNVLILSYCFYNAYAVADHEHQTHPTK
jgi:hypothetical protein